MQIFYNPIKYKVSPTILSFLVIFIDINKFFNKLIIFSIEINRAMIILKPILLSQNIKIRLYFANLVSKLRY